MEFGAVLKELTYKSVCLFLFSHIHSSLLLAWHNMKRIKLLLSVRCVFLRRCCIIYLQIQQIGRFIKQVFNRHKGKCSYCLTIYASNGTISKEGLKNKLDSIVKTITLLMKREDIILYDFQIYYYSENMNTSFHYEIGEN